MVDKLQFYGSFTRQIDCVSKVVFSVSSMAKNIDKCSGQSFDGGQVNQANFLFDLFIV